MLQRSGGGWKTRRVGVSWALCGLALTATVGAVPASAGDSPFRVRSGGDDLLIVDWEPESVGRALELGSPWVVRDVPLARGLTVDLELEPFRVTGPGTRFVVGRRGQPDRPLEFDPSKIALFRGTVVGKPGSHVFLSLADGTSTGYVDLGPGAAQYRFASRGADGERLASHTLSVFRALGAPSPPPDVPLCGLEHPPATKPGALPLLETAEPVAGLRHIELAVETDHELFSLFGDTDRTATYLVQLYAQVSDVYIRDVGARVELTFARVWDDPDDLFNDVDPSPLNDFRNYWENNMDHVHRDVAQLFSGRRDYPFGGQAYLSAVCSGNGYSVVGYGLGFFPDPGRPSPYAYDISVTAHELGHNAGAPHTHSSPHFIDTCDDPQTTPRRGTIMSYCSQTWSGGNANGDLHFHSLIQQDMEGLLGSRSCIAVDCNRNSVADADDVQNQTSSDDNGNGVPDECEDCNDNRVLDDADILSPTSADVNQNGIPDECEPDCDADGIPDSKEIADGTSSDQYGDDVPDECEADCDGDQASDFGQIQAEMTLDVDRDAVLDSCQTCAPGGSTDHQVLGGAHGAWVGSGLASAPLRRFFSSTGVLTATSTGQTLNEVQDVVVTAARHALASIGPENRVLEFDADGVYLGELVSPTVGQLDFPTGMVLRPSGTLLVASRDSNEVLAYDSVTGTPRGRFVLPGAGGLISPFGLTFGPNGNLFVTSGDDRVLEFDGQTGTFVRAFVNPGTNGGLDQPRGLVFKSDGNLLVASFGTDEVLEYEAAFGAPLGRWAEVGTATRLTQASPWGLRVGPNGNVFVVRTGEDFGSGASGADHEDHEESDDVVYRKASFRELHLTNAQMYEFDVRNGNFLRTHIGGNDHGLLFPTGFDFIPGWDIDCNLNQLPDECDVASGFSADGDLDGIPDECQVDCNGSGVQDRLDIIPFGASLDCNFNLVPDECEPGLTCIYCASDGGCDDGLSCTAEQCDSAWGLCLLDLAPDRCLIAEACHPALALNPADDCQVCDPAQPSSWTAAPPLDVEGLLLSRGSGTDLVWAGHGAPVVYDVARGALADLRADGGVSAASCGVEDLASPAWQDPAPDPAPGEGVYYIVRSQKSCGAGSYGESSDSMERIAVAACL